MNKNLLSFLFVLTILVSSCFPIPKKTDKSVENTFEEIVNLDTMMVSGKKPVYRETEKRENDLIHTKLQIEFDWKKQYVFGQAYIKIKPHFYETQTVKLDAKGFDLKDVALIKHGLKNKLNYNYDGKIIEIELDKIYNRNENYEIFIDYIAKPNELPKTGGSAAITDDKGLYFIDPLDTIADKPTQIWTQGETEASSCWFPTIDAPNQRTSQEIYLTVDNKYKTISNGKLMSSTRNSNGSRTDYWKQKISHAPYLFMVAVGEFAEVKDSWNGIETNYYVDKEYEKHAKAIFGNTGEMLDFFGKKFGLKYPWDKYHQVVVHDFVSGAMENTGAVIHFDGLHQTDRELLDGTHEDIIAHEAAHHWFGDYITCESWANIALNESFATFAEIIWERYKYGSLKAEEKILTDRNNYLAESMQYKVPLIRFFYENREDVFDRHSYQKGGQVLIMLEDYLGDEAFYLGLKNYLTKNALQSVEVHDLRLALEEITGEDLNWFFNQWFLGAGHPQLTISKNYDKELGQVILSVEQTQSEKPFMLPVNLNIHFAGNIIEKEIFIKKRKEVFTFDVSEKPIWLDFDVNNILLAEIDFPQSKDELISQFYKSKTMLKRADALQELDSLQSDENVALVFANALTDESDYIRRNVLSIIDKEYVLDAEAFGTKLKNIALEDKSSLVRASALSKLSRMDFPIEDELLSRLIKDRSYSVSANALKAIAKSNFEKAIVEADQLVANNESNENMLNAISDIYAQSGDVKYNSFYTENYARQKFMAKMVISNDYVDYLSNQNNKEIVSQGIGFFKKNALTEKEKWLRYKGTESLYLLKRNFDEKIALLKNSSSDEEASSEDSSSASLEYYSSFVEVLTATITEIKAQETDKDILLYYNFMQ